MSLFHFDGKSVSKDLFIYSSVVVAFFGGFKKKKTDLPLDNSGK